MSDQFSNQFRLSITEALSTQLYAALDRLEPAPLTQENLDALPAQAQKLGLPSMSGVYQLFRQEPGKERELTYVGKADQPLPKRLGDHLFKLSGRVGISLEEMSFRCLFVEEDLSAVSPEKMLIKRHLRTGRIVWNNRGFGINDPGRERDTTRNRENHFDLEFPIDLDLRVAGLTPGPQSLQGVLQAIKDGLPFNFRFQQRVAELRTKTVVVPDEEMTADQAFRFVSQHMPEEWQISALVGWAIMYRDNQKTYPSAFRYYRADGVVEQVPQTRKPGKGEGEDEVEGGDE
ncbi:GIY-YIG nuclease family protein [Actinomadura sp. GC306]|uniref:GIY-YIG nuclease family protein n=1 Tax=Actinomadura sp. GC306 TaxID=2530367 RepID=UPI00104B1335|nr:GIY-YIG nuclease family protein [Actinomadura sp. GC306]TDC69853.1 GIY-YIG nuclease family protein [Actinomadura sp. GC306]